MALFHADRRKGWLGVAALVAVAFVNFKFDTGFGWVFLDIALALGLVCALCPEWLTGKATPTGARPTIVGNLVGIFIVLAVGEAAVRLVAPQAYMSPRLVASPLYGMAAPTQTDFVNSMPGRWRFRYTSNEYGHRGPAAAIGNADRTPNVVLLGDSYTFGVGVDDGQEYAAVMAAALGDAAQVVNLGSPGWGLTQEMRRFYEFGRVYDPAVVLLQFCENDPGDNIQTPVTYIDGGRIAFRSLDSGAYLLRRNMQALVRYLGESVLQYSQIYEMFRFGAFEYLRRRFSRETGEAGAPELGQDKTYNTLLEAFAEDLTRRGIKLVFFSVNGEWGIGPHPLIRAKALELQAQGKLVYIDTEPLFDGKTGYESPEGHHWGVGGHKIIGDEMARRVRALLNR